MSGRLESANAVLKGLPDALLVASDGRVVEANAAAERLLGAGVSEILGRPLTELCGEDTYERLQAWLEDEDGGSFSVRFALPKLDGSGPVLVDCRAARTPDEDGSAPSTIAMLLREAADIARAEKLIDTLADLAGNDMGLSGLEPLLEAAAPMFVSLGWWSGLMRISPEGVKVLRLLSHPRGTTHPVVDFAEKIRLKGVLPWDGFPLVRKVYETGRPVFMPDLSAEMSAYPGVGTDLREILQKVGFNRGAWVPVRPGGETTHILIVVGPNLTEHDLAAMQLFAAYVGSAIRLESLQNELVSRERLAAVGEMAGVLAHEVRNPLAVIFNAVSGLRRALDGEDIHGLLSIIDEEADRLKRVIRDLVDFARPTVPEIRPVNLDELIHGTIEEMRSDRRRRSIPISVDLPSSLPPADADPHLLRRVLLNVLDNAFQSLEEEGSVQIRGTCSRGGELRLSVRNDGEPLSGEQLERAFMPFFTTRATGTGLGLTVVKRVVEDLGGRVALESDSDGVTLSMWLKGSNDRKAGTEERG